MASFEVRGTSVRAIVRVPGGKKKTMTFDTRGEAERWAEKIEGRKAAGELAGGVALTNGSLFEEYLDVAGNKTDTGPWNRLRLLKWCNDPIGKLKIGETGTYHINEWISRRLKQVAPGTVRRELNLMSAAFRYAVEVRKWIPTNPCHKTFRPAAPPPRNRPLLTEDEVKALIQATGYDMDVGLKTKTARVGAAFLLALETGMRSGEILRLRPEHYMRDRRTVLVAALEAGGRKSGKSGEVVRASRYVPLSETAIEILDKLTASMPADQKPGKRMVMPPYIVGMSDSSRDALWRKAVRQAGLTDRHFHDLKHEACTRMSRFLDVLELSHAIGTKDVRLLRDTYYVVDASAAAARLPGSLRKS